MGKFFSIMIIYTENLFLYRIMASILLWDHLRYLYENSQAASGLYIGHRLTREHVNLTSFSKMKVNLATQVLKNKLIHNYYCFTRVYIYLGFKQFSQHCVSVI